MLPISVYDQSKVEFALVIQKENNRYVAKTILELNWAYMNARNLVKLDTEWLQQM